MYPKIYYNIFTFKIHIKFSVKYNMSKKSISINPNFFKIGKAGKRTKEKKSRKQRPINTLKPNNVKKKLIEKIKAHQKREKEKEILAEDKEEKEFQDSFKDTLNYLQELDKKVKKKKKKKKRDKTMKKNSIPINTQPMVNPPNNFSHAPAPPYGCLKNGTKPTFRQYNKTLKKPKEKIDIPLNTSKTFDGNANIDDSPAINLTGIRFEKNEEFDNRKEKLETLKNMMKKEKPKTKRIKTRRIRRKITLGKIKNKVGVLVKSKKTRKIIKNEVSILKKKPIQEIKTYLKKHNLIKIGSVAPDYIFRTMYENAYLSGDVSNKNDEILLHNWSKEIPV